LRKNLSYLFVLLIVMSVMFTACGKAEDTPNVQFDSGVTNEKYQGVAKPGVQKKMKLSSEEISNGIEKVPLKSSLGQQLIPAVQVTSTPSKDQEGQVNENNAAKPQI